LDLTADKPLRSSVFGHKGQVSEYHGDRDRKQNEVLERAESGSEEKTAHREMSHRVTYFILFLNQRTNFDWLLAKFDSLFSHSRESERGL
jgi:hypothetical protein